MEDPGSAADGVSLSGQEQEPHEISVIVHSAKGLQPKKKGQYKFSVIFGVGSKKFRTDTIEDIFGSPTWNTEANISIDDASVPLVLTATERDSPLGQVTIPLNELPNHKPYQGKRVALQPHKKCTEPTGDIIVSVWVTALRTPKVAKSSPSGALKGLKKMKSKISHSPLLRRKSRSGESSSTGMKGSMSVGDIAGFGNKRKSNLLSMPSDSMCSINSTDSDASSQFVASCMDIRDDLKRPEVSGISPREGPVSGGTRLTIRGLNLGRTREDIIGLYVCGSDCLGTLEYESTSKMYCTTVKWKQGSGDIVVQTSSGGRGASNVHFTFVAKEGDSASPVPKKRMSPLVGSRKSPMLTHKKRLSDTSTLSTGSMNMSIQEDEEKPEVSGISPKEGPAEGGTRLTIRGQNLGENREDVVSLSICGRDCLAFLEYESSRKLFCTTKAWKPCKGNIILETKSGGKGSSTVQYTFVMPLSTLPPPSPATMRRIDHSLDNLDPEKLMINSAPSPAFSEDDDEDDVDMNHMKPEVTGISPREGPAEGGTRMTIRGINLGASRADITGLFICGANCLPMLEYESPMKLFCTTPPWKIGSGSIVVETARGGKGSSLVHFNYQKSAPKSAAPDVSVTPATPTKPPRKSISESPQSQVSHSPKTETTQPSKASVVSHSPKTETTQPSKASAKPATAQGGDEFGGAVPYPEAELLNNSSSRVDSAPTSTTTTPTTVTSARNSSRPPSQVLEETESRPQPLGQEKVASPVRDKKRQAPMPPPTSHQKPPPHPGTPASHCDTSPQVAAPVGRQLPSLPQENNKTVSDRMTAENQQMWNVAQKIGLGSESYITEMIPETQSGPTRQELMEEIRRLKRDNKDLRDQNRTTTQYLEKVLSDVMVNCPKILCVDNS